MNTPDPKTLSDDAFCVEVLLYNGKPRVRLIKPERVLAGRVWDKQSLINELDYRQHNAITLHAEDVSTRRWHMERERPALRYFCRKYGLPVPGWLEGCGGYDQLSPASFRQLFGERPLRPVEFKTWSELFPELSAK